MTLAGGLKMSRFGWLRPRNASVDNPPAPAANPSDDVRTFQDLGNHFNNIRADGERLQAAMKTICNRIGDACIVVGPKGDVSVHPDLIAEVEKPGNEGMAELLRNILKVGAHRAAANAM